MRSISKGGWAFEKIGSAVAFAVAIAGSAATQYHIVALSFAIGTVLYMRCGGKFMWPALFAGLIIVFASTQVFDLWQLHGRGGAKEIVMTMLGSPNPWPYLRFAAYFPPAIGIYVAIFLYFVILFVRGESIPDHVLFVLAAVWAPVFLIGFFAGHIPLRYVIGFVPFFILAFLAGLREILVRQSRLRVDWPWFVALIALPVLLVLIRPADLWHNVHPQYSDFGGLGEHRGVDHKGAAEYIRSLNLDSANIVVAEDVLQQTYYLEQVDYWLRSFTRYTYLRGDTYADIYTGTPHIGNADMLSDLIDRSDRGAIYIIGSAETSGNPEYYLGTEILNVLKRANPEVVYEGRDGATKVLRIAAPAAG